jgi:branched-chain amino acid transport system substrate-binding protein
MRKSLFGLLSATALAVAMTPAAAQDTIKVGLILTLSGQFADAGIQLQNGVKTYMQQHGDTVGGKKIELIVKDSGGPAPDVAKRLAQELIVRDKVDILAGFVLTPNALAASDVSAEAKKFMVIMNAATSIITTKSNYSVRSSVTLPQVAETFGTWAAKKAGVKKSYTMVTDYGPGHDFEGGFQRAFKEAGGEITGSVRFPVANPDFSAFVQRAKDLNPESIMIFIPGGAQPAALGKAFAERGVDPNKTKILGSGETTAEQALKSMGDSSLGIITAWHYEYADKSNAKNVAFVKAFNDMHKRNPDFFSIGGYDGMHVIYESVKKAGGKTDGDSLIAAAKGLKWDSPRGPMSIDPETRDVVQTIYIRKVEKVNGEPQNVAFDKVENVKDPVKARMPK